MRRQRSRFSLEKIPSKTELPNLQEPELQEALENIIKLKREDMIVVRGHHRVESVK